MQFLVNFGLLLAAAVLCAHAQPEGYYSNPYLAEQL